SFESLMGPARLLDRNTEGWAALRALDQSPEVPFPVGGWLTAYVSLDLVLIVTYYALAYRVLATRHRPALRLVGLAALADLVENALAAVAWPRAPGATAPWPVAARALTRLFLLLVVLVLRARVPRARHPAPARAAAGRPRRARGPGGERPRGGGLAAGARGHRALAGRGQRPEVALPRPRRPRPPAPAAGLRRRLLAPCPAALGPRRLHPAVLGAAPPAARGAGVVPGPDMLDQLPDIQRRWVQGDPGHGLAAGVALAILAASVRAAGRMRADYTWWRVEGWGPDHPRPEPLVGFWFIATGVILVLGLGMTWATGTAGLSVPRMAIFVGVPLLVGL